MEKYTYIISNGHHLACIDGALFVIDTGSPLSFSLKDGLDEVTINGERCSLVHNPFCVNSADVNGLVGTEVSGFIGMDLLCRFGSVTFDKKTMTVCFSGSITPSESTELQVRSIMGIKKSPILQLPVKVRNQTVSALLDTGAFLGYIAPGLAADAEVCGIAHDFNPQIGEITGEKCRIKLTVGSQEYDTELVKMPQILEMTVSYALGLRAILGLNHFKADVIRLDIAGGRLEFA